MRFAPRAAGRRMGWEQAGVGFRGGAEEVVAAVFDVHLGKGAG